MEFDDEHIIRMMAEKQFHYKANRPLGWRLSASRLKLAADYLYEISQKALTRELELSRQAHEEMKKSGSKVNTRNCTDEEIQVMDDADLRVVSLMLWGLAIENLAKAVIITKHVENVDERGRFKHKSKTHRLGELVRQCLVTDENTDLMLEYLSSFITWRGRYPIPLETSNMGTDEIVKQQINLLLPTLGGTKEFVDSLFEQLNELSSTSKVDKTV